MSSKSVIDNWTYYFVIMLLQTGEEHYESVYKNRTSENSP